MATLPKRPESAALTLKSPERIVEPEDDDSAAEDVERPYPDGSMPNECWHIPQDE